MRLLWQTTAHLVTDGASACGVSRCLPDQWTAAPDSDRCRRCRAKAGEQVTPWPWRRVRRRYGYLPAGVYAGVDPLVAAIRRHEQHTNRTEHR